MWVFECVNTPIQSRSIPRAIGIVYFDLKERNDQHHQWHDRIEAVAEGVDKKNPPRHSAKSETPLAFVLDSPRENYWGEHVEENHRGVRVYVWCSHTCLAKLMLTQMFEC